MSAAYISFIALNDSYRARQPYDLSKAT